MASNSATTSVTMATIVATTITTATAITGTTTTVNTATVTEIGVAEDTAVASTGESSAQHSRRKYLRSRRTGNEVSTLKATSSSLIGKAKALVCGSSGPLCDKGESYFEDPKKILCVAKPPRLVCQICLESLHDMRAREERSSDELFLLLPCGHVAGAVCMRKWLEESGGHTCPFCRFDVRRPGCDHRIEPFPLNKRTIRDTPRTLPAGGRVRYTCDECFQAGQVSLDETMLNRLSDPDERTAFIYNTGSW